MLRVIANGSVLIAVTYGLARFSLGLFVPEIRADLGLTSTTVGAVVGSSFAGFIGGLFVAGSLVGRIEARTVAASAGIVAAAGMAGIASASGPVILASAAGLAGASTGLASPSLAALVEGRVPRSTRPLAQSVINAGTSLGLIVAVPVAVAAATAWRAAWWVFAGSAVLVVVGLLLAVPADRRTATSPARAPTVRLSARLQASAVLLGLSSAAFWSFGREILEVASGLGPGVSRLGWVAVGAVGLLGALAGSLARAIGLRAAVGLMGLLLAVSLGVLALGPTSTPAALGAAGLFGAGYMALTGLVIVGSVAERPQTPASAVATGFLVLAAGQIAGSLLAGGVADHVGLTAAFWVAAVLASAIVVTAPASTPLAPGSGSVQPRLRPHRRAADLFAVRCGGVGRGEVGLVGTGRGVEATGPPQHVAVDAVVVGGAVGQQQLQLDRPHRVEGALGEVVGPGEVVQQPADQVDGGHRSQHRAVERGLTSADAVDEPGQPRLVEDLAAVERVEDDRPAGIGDADDDVAR